MIPHIVFSLFLQQKLGLLVYATREQPLQSFGWRRGRVLFTKKDYPFASLSGAANFVGGCALNGKICWTETRKEPKSKKRKG